jgi:hypothetical protein
LKIPPTFIVLASLGALCRAEKVDFSRDVQPIFTKNCFLCHGPDGSSRKAELRLDVRENALTDHDSGVPIVPGKPEMSELIARITAEDVDDRMPPKKHGNPLTAEQVKTLKDWIAQGAEYTEHWAFVPPKKAPLPTVKDTAWAATPVDRFVLQTLEREKLAPVARASRETLIRRATLDLIGLPPTPEEIEAFVSDRSPDAYARVIDRLLASPHYGERWGRHWLDVARYADSGGFETDIFFGHAWRYRDYVIRSFNADKPFDQFVKEQIAGDELYPGNEEARIATGLYTTGPVLQEAGMVTGKLEYDQNTDAVDTTGAAFLGLSVGCARCHDHKYDPIAQKEYYSLQALFAASDQFDYSVDGKKLRDRAALKPTLKEFEAEQARARVVHETDPKRREELIRKTGDAYIEADDGLKGRIDASKRYNTMARAIAHYQAVQAGQNDATEAVDMLAADPDDTNDIIALKAVLSGVLHSKPSDKIEAALLDVGVIALLNPDRSMFRRGGGGGRRAAAAAGNAKAATGAAGNGKKDDGPPAAAVAAAEPASPPPEGFRFGRRAFNALTSDDEKRQFLLDLGKREIERPKPEGYVADIDALRLETGQSHLNAPSAIPIRVLDHREKPLEVHLLKRGELEMPGEVVEPGVPKRISGGATVSFANLPATRRRAALAEWITAPDNALTARVIANRVWQWHFGQGLVRTPNDFGIAGDRPTHPELLDWLAVELVEHGWQLKHLHRVIMLSNTYQMAATADAETLARDPENGLLTRFQPHRLEAEVIWDSLRAASGKLDLTLYGLPVAPPLDEQEQLGNYRKWPTSAPEEANRRAIYLLVKRSFRFPMLSAFDLPDNISSCGRRDITTIPNQALTLLNNGTMRQHAAQFAERLVRETHGQVAAIPARAWLLAYGRTISREEEAQATSFLRDRSAADRGNLPAALSELCLALFNTNEFIYQQ